MNLRRVAQQSTFRLIVVLVVAELILAASLEARPRHPPARRHQTLISAITPTQLTISEDHGPKTFTVTPYTEVFLDEHRAGFADLRPGMRVSVTLDDPVRLRQIKAWTTQ